MSPFNDIIAYNPFTVSQSARIALYDFLWNSPKPVLVYPALDLGYYVAMSSLQRRTENKFMCERLGSGSQAAQPNMEILKASPDPLIYDITTTNSTTGTIVAGSTDDSRNPVYASAAKPT